MEKYSRKAAGGKCKTSEKFGIASKTKGGQKNYKAIQEIPGKHQMVYLSLSFFNYSEKDMEPVRQGVYFQGV